MKKPVSKSRLNAKIREYEGRVYQAIARHLSDSAKRELREAPWYDQELQRRRDEFRKWLSEREVIE